MKAYLLIIPMEAKRKKIVIEENFSINCLKHLILK